ncbi:MAG TPA: hypoxanthine phosphoribosyltransferase [Clostridiaceae bacterium]|nr:hypoxanthine phosphoribosyltransferase [Clostridiaceae bacterium]
MNGLGKILYTEEEIRRRVKETADEINSHYGSEELVVISILKGSIYFLTDLTRQLTMPLEMDFLSIGVRKDETRQRTITFIKDLDISITGRNVLLIEDVIGTGLTLGYVLQHIESYKPKTLRICSLLDNPAKRLLNFDVHHTCFVMPDLFVVGYGLDYKEKYRNLKDIVEYRKD